MKSVKEGLNSANIATQGLNEWDSNFVNDVVERDGALSLKTTSYNVKDS